jgi:hypothetical protein
MQTALLKREVISYLTNINLLSVTCALKPEASLDGLYTCDDVCTTGAVTKPAQDELAKQSQAHSLLSKLQHRCVDVASAASTVVANEGADESKVTIVMSVASGTSSEGQYLLPELQSVLRRILFYLSQIQKTPSSTPPNFSVSHSVLQSLVSRCREKLSQINTQKVEADSAM